VFPNPASEELFVKLPNVQPTSLSVFDMKGKKLISGKGNRLDIGSLPSGFYCIEIHVGQLKDRKKILVQR
jgi:hypothetical protein